MLAWRSRSPTRSARRTAGITHRDLKPGERDGHADGRVKVLDFGLAKLKESNAVAAADAADAGADRRRAISARSPTCRPSRRRASRSIRAATSSRSAWCCTRWRPGAAVQRRHAGLDAVLDPQGHAASVTDLRAELPRDLARIVRRCLSKDPEDRYQTAKDLRNELRALKEDLSSGAVAAAETGASPDRWTLSRRETAVASRWPSPSSRRSRLPRPRSCTGRVMLACRAQPRRRIKPFASVSLNRLTTTGRPASP